MEGSDRGSITGAERKVKKRDLFLKTSKAKSRKMKGWNHEACAFFHAIMPPSK